MVYHGYMWSVVCVLESKHAIDTKGCAGNGLLRSFKNVYVLLATKVWKFVEHVTLL